ncbi:MAG: type I restriction enzyme HsdR N-terminal domain-containing protein [Verrucomicrobiota bacterium]
MKSGQESQEALAVQALAGQSFSNTLHRRPFYSVPRSAYIHVGPFEPDSKREESEEAVRQWCAFELMRAYGLSVWDLNFEAQVQVGSKFYRVDILVLRSGIPWIVVECKAPHAKSDKAIEQAISYADSPRIQAEYVLYTNGTDWQVRRRLKGQWEPVLDLPCMRFELDGSVDVTHFFACFADVAPLLYKLDETIEGKEAQCFLQAMQKFFCGWNLLTEGVEIELTGCADNLLRVMSSPGTDYAYCSGKYNIARSEFCRFRARHGVAWEVYPIAGEVPVRTGFLELQSAVLRAIEGTSKSAGPNVFVLRLIAALLDYGIESERRRNPFITITANIHHSLREFLQYQFKVRFDAMLPDPVDQIGTSDFKLYCSGAWKDALQGVRPV